MDETPELWRRIAEMAFERGLNKQEIAVELDIDARKVPAILNNAGRWLLREQERLEAITTTALDQPMADALRRKFSGLLIHCAVVKTPEVTTNEQYVRLFRRLGQEGARYFDELSAGDDELHVMVAGGETVLEMVSSLSERRRPNVFYYPCGIIGRGRQLHMSHVGPETNVTIAWQRSGRVPGHMIYATAAPLLSTSREQVSEELDDLAQEDHVRPLLKDLRNVNAAIGAIGLVQRYDPFGKSGHALSSVWLLEQFGVQPATLASEGAIGDMAYAFFNAEGKGDSRWRFHLTAGDPNGVAFYRKLVEARRPVIVMAGTYKVEGIRAALTGRLFNVLITDEHTARTLLA